MGTAIEWTDETWNPVTGCAKVSQGCKFCYAERFFPRVYSPRKFTDVKCHPDRLAAPLHWKKPRRVFVNSMSDLFHEAVPDEFIQRVLQSCFMAPQHTFQILTKRPERMRDLMILWQDEWGVDDWAPARNVHLGVSCEDQETANERIPLLLQTPAAVRFVSLEPLLGPIDLDCWEESSCPRGWLDEKDSIDWVIVGGESGPRARPCDVGWLRSILAQCKAAGVACFVKQLGSKPTGWWTNELGPRIGRFKHKKGGDWNEWPEDIRVREFPKA